MLLLPFVVLLTLMPSTTARNRKKEKKCQAVTAGICKQKVHMGYNSTYYPNELGHRTQFEAIAELNAYSPLIKINCSEHLATFLCSLYVPYCHKGAHLVISPCREMCEHARDGCSPIMQRYGFKWHFNCSTYPSSANDQMCMGRNIFKTASKTPVVVDTSKKQKSGEGKEKNRSRKGWIYGSHGQKLNLACKDGKTIHIKKVRTSADSGCCSHASKAVLNAICGSQKRCQVKVAKETLGAHCVGKLTKLQIRYKCVHQVKKNLCTND